MKSGKQYYVVKHKSLKQNGKVTWYPNDCIVRFREEEIFEYDLKLKS